MDEVEGEKARSVMTGDRGSASVGFVGSGASVVTPTDHHRSCLLSRGFGGGGHDGTAVPRRRTVISMSYAKKNKKKKKLMKKGLIKKPEETRLLDLPLPETLENDICIVWFRKDLRVSDNECLRLANTAQSVLPVYIFDEREFGPENTSSFGFEKTGPFQSAFLVESVKDLRRSLRQRGAELYIRTGRPEQVIANMCREYLSTGNNVHVVAQKEVTKEETTIEFLLQRSLKRISTEDTQAKLHLVWGSTLHHIQDLPYTASNFFPISFTTFKQRVDRRRKRGLVRQEIPAPEVIQAPPNPEPESGDVPSLSKDLNVSGLMEPLELEKPFPHPQACYSWHGGETEGLSRIDDFVWKKKGLFYFQERRHESGYADFSTKLSPYLALGCVSPRTVYWEAMKFQEIYPRKQQQGSFQVEVQLQWRDFFRLTAVVYKNQLFARDGLGQMDKRGRLTARTFAQTKPTEEQWEMIQCWMDGMTGIPYIDSAMRELKSTGYMSNRARQNSASYLMHDIRCPDWRIGAEYFQSKLIDHDVTSNWMGWQYIARVSNDPKHGKRYPVLKQALQYDQYGFFARRWCPELALIPEPEVHVPFLLTAEEQKWYDIKIGKGYPMPVVRPWKIPTEVDRPTEAPPEVPQPRQRRKLEVEEEVEELAAAAGINLDPEVVVDDREKFFVDPEERTDGEEEEFEDDEDDFLAELMSLDEEEEDRDEYVAGHQSTTLDDEDDLSTVQDRDGSFDDTNGAYAPDQEDRESTRESDTADDETASDIYEFASDGGGGRKKVVGTVFGSPDPDVTDPPISTDVPVKADKTPFW